MPLMGRGPASPLVRGKGASQQAAVGSEYLGVSLPQVCRQASATLDVGVEHREGAAG